jgi:hypothetical protein
VQKVLIVLLQSGTIHVAYLKGHSHEKVFENIPLNDILGPN